MGTAKECAVLLESKVDFDEIRASEKLHDHSRGDDGCDTELHKRTTVRGEDDTHPVERVRRVGRHNAIERHLGTN